jgi:hypothetical protein
MKYLKNQIDMSKVGLPPKKENPKEKNIPSADERRIREVISRGSSTTRIQIDAESDTIKTIAVKLTVSTLDIIGQLCDKRTKRPGRKIAMAKYDWIVEAVNEKIEREKHDYDMH